MNRIFSQIFATIVVLLALANIASAQTFDDEGRRWGLVLGGTSGGTSIVTTEVVGTKTFESGATIDWAHGIYDFGFILDQSKTRRKGVEEVVLVKQWTEAGKYLGIAYRYTYPLVRKSLVDFGPTFGVGYGRDTGKNEFPLEALATARILHTGGAIAFSGGKSTRTGLTFGCQFQFFNNRGR